ncbi:MAG: cellulase family glycosylhydrolase [Chloroflexi bacterium]|nr:cellulase family glycosylhydrolase [Chloroflexota bacterium]
MNPLIRRCVCITLTITVVGSFLLVAAAGALRHEVETATASRSGVGGRVSSVSTRDPGPPIPNTRPPTPGLVPPAAPTPPPEPKKPNYFSTRGAKIVDASGNEVRITGVNWFGMETGTYAPHGLWARRWTDMLDQIAALGYNTIRLPYSNAILDLNSRPLEGIDFDLNPDLRGLNGLELMDRIVQGAGERGLKVILDRHRPTPQGQSKLWYTDEVGEEQWIADWQTLAQRYRENDTVIGADLHNEPAGNATWGTGDPKTDWRLAAERAGNAILAVNPDWLIIVEGIERYENDWYWMGGSLQGAGLAPVRLSRPDKLVYSAHDYGPGVFNQGWFQAPDFPRNLPTVWDKRWGYLVRQNVAPVLVGEFGGKSVSPIETEGIWQRQLLGYLKDNGIHFTYWSFNPNSVDTGGLLQDDWQAIDHAKQSLLASYLAPRSPVLFAGAVDRGVPVATRKNPLPAVPVTVLLQTPRQPSNGDGRTPDLTPQFQIVNHTPSRLPLEQVQVRYWFTAGADAAALPVSIDWASVGDVHPRVIAAPQSGQVGDPTHQLVVTFGKNSGMVPAKGMVEIKLRLKQVNGEKAGDDQIALYFWGRRLWGREPAMLAENGVPGQAAQAGLTVGPS